MYICGYAYTMGGMFAYDAEPAGIVSFHSRVKADQTRTGKT